MASVKCWAVQWRARGHIFHRPSHAGTSRSRNSRTVTPKNLRVNHHFQWVNHYKWPFYAIFNSYVKLPPCIAPATPPCHPVQTEAQRLVGQSPGQAWGHWWPGCRFAPANNRYQGHNTGELEPEECRDLNWAQFGDQLNQYQ